MVDPSVVGLVVAAGVIGVTHAVEPDHVAGIAALTGGATDRRLSAVVGACFATGHVLLVLGWVAVATLLLDVSDVPPSIESAGLVLAGLALTGFGTLLGASAARRLVHRHEHHHDQVRHTHVHLHGPANLLRQGTWSGDSASPDSSTPHPHPGTVERNHGPGSGDHEHKVTEYLLAGTVGALFTLSPPLSMIAFISLVLANTPASVVGTVLLTYAAAITLTMGVIGFGAGTVARVVRAKGPRAYAVLQLAVAGIVLVVAATLLKDHLPHFLNW